MKDDTISRRAAIDTVRKAKDKSEAHRMLIQMPPAQPELAQDLPNACSDAISRQAAIKAADSIIERDTSGNNDVVKAMTAWKEYVKALPSAQPGWIPVTEKLPEVKQRVLVQQKDGFMMVRKCIDGGHLAWFYSDIVAWMPLPAPWKGGQS